MDEHAPQKLPGVDDILDKSVVEQTKGVQRRILARLGESKRQLHDFNEESSSKFSELNSQLQSKVKLLSDMHKDLLHVYQQLRCEVRLCTKPWLSVLPSVCGSDGMEVQHSKECHAHTAYASSGI
eukprot:evm.model.scf_1397.3 EVM.evm.TU.scf_1397.3   scf_1397:17996-19222(+)